MYTLSDTQTEIVPILGSMKMRQWWCRSIRQISSPRKLLVPFGELWVYDYQSQCMFAEAFYSAVPDGTVRLCLDKIDGHSDRI